MDARPPAPDSERPPGGPPGGRPAPPWDERVGVAAPVGRDGPLIASRLSAAGVPAEVCADLGALGVGVGAGRLGVVILTTESVIGANGAADAFRRTLAEQPPWSDVPVLLLAAPGQTAGDSARALGRAVPSGATVLDRPLSSSSLVAAARLAVLARRRQLDVRDLLVALGDANATLESRVEARTAEVRRLAAALTLAEHEERRRVAHLLHEDLQQRLYGLQIKLGLLGRHVAADGAALLDEAERVLDEAARLTRTLSHEMAPPVLGGGDVAELLEWLAEQAGRLHGLRVDVDVADGLMVGEDDLRVLLHRVLQELLFNVSKHAGTGRARLTAEPVGGAGGAVRVTVSDDGAGFDAAGGRGGLGLASVRERVGLVGGRLAVDSAPGAGTRVTVEVPAGGADRAVS
ncbi:sensor histidine kinase [Rubrivirga litoralis]|uniref:histidine kinase n=1 Tax=Rubrivirga litoralis TaxID=3075598 RepID=A0ABU3BSF6_9BACT|nr:ATP-binding protein [Rubrivirga sp. F394]MDT0632233.1 ATP-binding protein [Rubrivirga sp. F394]